MPVQIRNAVIALILSCISSLVSLVLNEVEGGEYGYSDTYSLVFSLIWVVIIIWIVWDVVKNRKDIRITLVIVSIIMFGATLLDLLASEFMFARVFDGIELVLWLIAFLFLNTRESKDWYAQNVES